MRTTIQFRDKSFDDWKARGPHEDMPSVRDVPLPPREHCEHCGASVAGVSVASCGDHFSYFPSRPERRGGR